MAIITTLWKTMETTEINDDYYILTLVLHVTCQVMQEHLAVMKNGVHEKRLYVKATGDVSFRAFIDNQPYIGMLKNVLYVPKLGVNLVSICSAT